jgi:hypothetical protein
MGRFGTVSINLADDDVGRLWWHYKSLQGKDAAADVIVGLIRKLVTEIAMAIPYGSWTDRLSHPLRRFGISKEEWEEDGG